PLDEVQRQAESAIDFVRKAKFGHVIDVLSGLLGVVRSLRGLPPAFVSLEDGPIDEERFRQHLEGDPRLAVAACWYWIRKLQARFHADGYASALAAAAKAAPRVWSLPSFFEVAEYHFHGALTRAALHDEAPPGERSTHRAALDAHYRQLEVWADNCPENFEN